MSNCNAKGVDSFSEWIQLVGTQFAVFYFGATLKREKRLRFREASAWIFGSAPHCSERRRSCRNNNRNNPTRVKKPKKSAANSRSNRINPRGTNNKRVSSKGSNDPR
jgi:hypothetical protein